MLGSDCRRYYYDKKQIAKSVEAFKLALDINPMYEGIWFTLGWAADLNDQGSSEHGPQELAVQRFIYNIYERPHCHTSLEVINSDLQKHLVGNESSLPCVDPCHISFDNCSHLLLLHNLLIC